MALASERMGDTSLEQRGVTFGETELQSSEPAARLPVLEAGHFVGSSPTYSMLYEGPFVYSELRTLAFQAGEEGSNPSRVIGREA